MPKSEHDPQLGNWTHWLKAYGDVPGHLKTPHAFEQALEISRELKDILGGLGDVHHVLRSFAFHVCKAHAEGRNIRSFAFIAEVLARQAEDGLDDWLWHVPSIYPAADFEAASMLARRWVEILEAYTYGLVICGDMLASTTGAEKLLRVINDDRLSLLLQAVNHVTTNKIIPDGIVTGWSWFEQFIVEPKAAKRRKAAA